MAQPAPNARATEAILHRLTALHPKSIDLSLDRVLALLRDLGDPHRKLPPVIHVAGTNGKGSLIAYLRAMFEAAGRRVHVYTSPHLVRFNERIRVAGKLVEDERLIDLLQRCEQANGDRPITFFEATTAAAFMAFAETPADVLLLETGLGGRLDATNVIERPALTAITPISVDHQSFLGDTLAAIAGEKAGIMKPGVPCVIGPQTAGPAEVFARRADELGIELFRHGADWRAARDGDALRWSGNDVLTLPLPALSGRHQIDNAGTAVACMQKLGALAVDETALATGLRRVEWPARLQRLRRGPLLRLLPLGGELWLDGGHNPAAGDVLAQAMGDFAASDGRPLLLVCGMLNSKDPRGFLAPLAPLVRAARTVAIPGEANTLSAYRMAQAAASVGLDAPPADNLEAAVAALLSAPSVPAPRVLICGSLYLAGHVLAEHG
jgi:dihydrofolate synthase/folylpolyglutamate synthase